MKLVILISWMCILTALTTLLFLTIRYIIRRKKQKQRPEIVVGQQLPPPQQTKKENRIFQTNPCVENIYPKNQKRGEPYTPPDYNENDNSWRKF